MVDGAKPKQTVTRFTDWELICPSGGSASATASAAASCYVSQRLAARGSTISLFMMTIMPDGAAESKPLVAVLSTPLGGYLTPGLELRIDKGLPMRVLYETCTPNGCHAGFALTATVRGALLAGGHLQVRLWTTRNQPVDVDVSLAGLTTAISALAGVQP